MNTIKNNFLKRINTIKTWWSNNHEQVEKNVANGVRRLGKGFDRLVRNIIRLIIIGLILNVISNYFYPEFPERFPVIYGWFDGWLNFGEFAYKAALTGIYALFTGNWSTFWIEYEEAVQEMLQQFINWIATLHF